MRFALSSFRKSVSPPIDSRFENKSKDKDKDKKNERKRKGKEKSKTHAQRIMSIQNSDEGHVDERDDGAGGPEPEERRAEPVGLPRAGVHQEQPET